MAAEWYVKISDREVGPLSSRQLKAMADRSQLAPDDPVRRGSQGAWVPASRVRGLFSESTPSDKPSPEPTASQTSSESVTGSPSEEGGAYASPTDHQEQSTQAASWAASEPYPVAQPVDPMAAAGAEVPVAAQPSATEASSHPTGQVAPEGSVPYAAPVSPAGQSVPPNPVSASQVPPSSLQAAQSNPLTIVTDTDGSPGQAAAGGGVDAGAKRRRRQNLAFIIAAVGLVVVVTGVAVFVFSRPTGAGDSNADASLGEQGDPSSTKPKKRRDIHIPGLDAILGDGDAAEKENQTPSEEIATAGSKEPEEKWVDASQDVSLCGEVAVKVVAAEIGYAVLTRGGQSRLRTPEGDEYLTIKLELASQSDEHETQYTGWAARPAGVKLVDGSGQPCEMKTFRTALVLGQKRQATTIEPSGAIEDVLLFHKPADETDFLALTLPGLAIGEPGLVRFHIPMSMVALKTELAKSNGSPAEGEPDDLASEPPSDPDHPRAPGRPLPEVERAIAEISAEEGAEATESTPPMESDAETQPAMETEEPEFGPIGIPGLHDEDAEKDSDKEVSDFEDDPELMKKREQMLRQRAEERERQKRAGTPRSRRDRR